MDQKNEQKAPLRIKNMAELKRCIRPGTELVATSHSKHPALVGLVRVVTEVQTNAYYSVVKDQPSHQYSTCNYGKGFRSDFEKASNYLFEGTTIKVLDRRSSDGSVLYEMELYPGEYLVLGQKNDMEENADIREDNGEIKQEGMNMTLRRSVRLISMYLSKSMIGVEARIGQRHRGSSWGASDALLSKPRSIPNTVG